MTLVSGCLRGSLIAVLLVASSSAALAASPTFDRIRTSGAIQLACRDGAAPFAFKDRARMEKVDISVPVFVDGVSVLVRANGKVKRLADLHDHEPALREGDRVRVYGTQLELVPQ